MPTTRVSLNAYDPVCTVNSCLNQVIGSLDNNPLVQYASCTSLYGSPVVSTVTLAAEIALETTTSTLSYTDIIIEVSTTESVAKETSTSYLSLFETETAYTTTVTSTDKVIATLVGDANSVQRRNVQKKHRRRGCGGRPSSASVASSTQVSSVIPSSSVFASSSAVIASSTAPSSSAPLSSITSLPPCTDSAQLYSACSCINAIRTVSLVTESASASTSTVHETISITLTETSTSVVTIAITTVVVLPMTTTLVSTLKTGTTTTTTTTSTTTVKETGPIQTGLATFDVGESTGLRLIVGGGGAVQQHKAFGSSIGWTFDGGSPYLTGYPDRIMWVRVSSGTVGALYFLTVEEAHSDNDSVAVSCKVDRATGVLGCLAENGYSAIFSCGGYLYMANKGWTFGTCWELTIKVIPVVG